MKDNCPRIVALTTLVLLVDDYSRKLLALPLKPDETSYSISDVMEEALGNARREGHNPSTRPKMLSDNGPGFIGQILADYLKARGIGHIFGAPYHPQMQGKVERFNRNSSIFNVSPNQMYAGRFKKILKRRAAIKRKTLNRRRLENLGEMAQVSVSKCSRSAEPLHASVGTAALPFPTRAP
ncbi:MAG: hypothetical protein AAB268_07020 [Elusimicrobiota bacterium]